MEIAHIKVTFDGIYSWGKGWEDDTCKCLWDEFWRSRNDIFWHLFEREYSQYLVSTSAMAYLHPMGFEVIEKSCGKSYRFVNGRQVRVFPEIEELKEICEKCAEYCNCKVSFTELKLREVEF